MTAAEPTTPGSSFRLDGTAIPFEQGQSIGAALVAAGVRSWRSTRVENRPRGILCGIGICYDCLLTVDSRPNVRACITPAVEGAEVVSSEGTGHG